ncbi:MAG: PAS domain S-box protein, partial [Planctomycetales bacterium]|nr:PAS domain S-box protein [Planctomycetales bacterium]
SSAIETGTANFVLPPEQMAETLLHHLEHPYPPTTEPQFSPAIITTDSELAAVFALLLNQYEIDFTLYKSATVTRRIHRRMELSGAANLDDFVALLTSDPDELNRLYKDLLIGVTQFFRDSDAFDMLQKEALAGLLSQKGPEDEVRVWDAGCATGEEAYSLAILLLELMQDLDHPPSLKVFATDVHRDSLDFAAAGSYDSEAIGTIVPSRLERFFVREGDRWRVSSELRKQVVFAPHNIVKDAPFTKLDLVVCRNLLIYLLPEMQQRIMATFHYALNVGGTLMLGPSESVGELADEFETLNSHWRLYTKRRYTRPDSRMRLPLTASLPRPREAIHARLVPGPPPSPSPKLIRAYDALLAECIPASILVDERYEVAHIFGDARRFLHPPSGRPTSDVLSMVDNDLRVALSAALQRATKEQSEVTYDAVPVRDTGLAASHNATTSGNHQTSTPASPVELSAKLTVKPILDRQHGYGYFLISFETRDATPPTPPAENKFDSAEISGERISSLESELAYTRESLQATVEELQTSNEELQATNEELVASNEELQSTNEELHSVNEELHTVNTEYQNKIGELTQLTADMDNLLLSTEVGVIYLDLNLRIRKFTPSVAEFFNLLPQDIGRPISHISGQVQIDELRADVQQVLDTGKPCEHEVQGGNAPFLLRILPYRDIEFKVQGVVLAFIEIAELKRAEEQVRITSERYHTLFEAAPCGFVKVDQDGTIVMVNAATLDLFGYDRSELIGRRVESLIPHALRDDHARYRDEYVRNPIPRQMGRDSYVVGLRKDGSEFPAEVGLNSIATPDGPRVLAWVIDITKRRHMEDQRSRLLEAAFAVAAPRHGATIEQKHDPYAQCLVVGQPANEQGNAIADALRVFAGQVRTVIGSHQAGIHYIPNGDFSTAHHARSLSVKYEKYAKYDVVPAGQGLWQLVIGSKQPACMTQAHIESHPLWKNFSDKKDLRGLEHPPLRGWLAVPILGNESGEFLGILQFSDKYEGDFTAEDVHTATQLAQLINPILMLQFVNDQINDLVERRTEQLSEANEALARSNDELQQFAYVASHDLQEPLRKIVSYCQMLQEDQGARLDESGQTCLTIAIDGAKRLQRLVRDLLSFSRITTRAKPLVATDANVSFLEAVANLEMAIKDKGANVSAEPLPTVLADQGQLTILFQNLIGNAIKYCEDPTPSVHVSVRLKGDMFEFSVKDNGIGFEAKYNETVFEIFRRLHNRREYSGTGIGLAICKRIVERCGGDMWVESTPGDGSTFYFTLLSTEDLVGQDVNSKFRESSRQAD